MKVSAFALSLLVPAALLIHACTGNRQKRAAENMPEWWASAPPKSASHLFAIGTATSEDRMHAVDQARHHAVSQLGAKTEKLISRVTRRFAEELSLQQDSTLFAQFAELCRAVSDSILVIVSQIEKQEIRQEPDGNHKAYVLVSMPIGAIRLAIIEMIKLKKSAYARIKGTETFDEMAREAEENPPVPEHESEKLRDWLQQFETRESLEPEPEKLFESVADTALAAGSEQLEKLEENVGELASQLRRLVSQLERVANEQPGAEKYLQDLKQELEKLYLRRRQDESKENLKTEATRPSTSEADSTLEQMWTRLSHVEKDVQQFRSQLSGLDSKLSSEIMDDMIERLRYANIAFNTPETMMVDESRQVVLLMSTGLLGAALEENIRLILHDATKAGRIDTDSVKISLTMEAHLSGKGFTITPLTPIEQIVLHQGFTRWEWTVHAIEPGTKILFLTLNALVSNNGETTRHTIQTYRKEVVVNVAALNAIAVWVDKNRDWLIAALSSILAAFLSAFFTYRYTLLLKNGKMSESGKRREKNLESAYPKTDKIQNFQVDTEIESTETKF
jgi:archaellum component FlaC